jgi:hypothetical protein
MLQAESGELNLVPTRRICTTPDIDDRQKQTQGTLSPLCWPNVLIHSKSDTLRLW